MKDHTRVVIVSLIDTVVAALIAVIGVMLLLGSSKMGILGLVGAGEVPTIFLVLGLLVLIYGIKRLIDDVLKVFVK